MANSNNELNLYKNKFPTSAERESNTIVYPTNNLGETPLYPRSKLVNNVLPIAVSTNEPNLTRNIIKKGGKRKSRRSHKKFKKFNKSKKSVRKH